MTNLQIIESLCYLVERQAALIRSLATALEEERTLTEAERIAVDTLQSEYTAIIGADEAPDNL